jgi:hypothetical protein
MRHLCARLAVHVSIAVCFRWAPFAEPGSDEAEGALNPWQLKTGAGVCVAAAVAMAIFWHRDGLLRGKVLGGCCCRCCCCCYGWACISHTRVEGHVLARMQCSAWQCLVERQQLPLPSQACLVVRACKH